MITEELCDGLDFDTPLDWSGLQLFHPKVQKLPRTLGGFQRALVHLYKYGSHLRESVAQREPLIIDLLAPILKDTNTILSFFRHSGFASSQPQVYFSLIDAICKRVGVPDDDLGKIFGLHVLSSLGEMVTEHLSPYIDRWSACAKHEFVDLVGIPLLKNASTDAIAFDARCVDKFCEWNPSYREQFFHKYEDHPSRLRFGLRHVQKPSEWYIEKALQHLHIEPKSPIGNDDAKVVLSYVEHLPSNIVFSPEHPLHSHIVTFLNRSSRGSNRLAWFDWVHLHYAADDVHHIFCELLRTSTVPNALLNTIEYITHRALDKPSVYGEILLNRLQQFQLIDRPMPLKMDSSDPVIPYLQIWSFMGLHPYWRDTLTQLYPRFQDWDSSTVNAFLVPLVFDLLDTPEKQRFAQYIYRYPEASLHIEDKILKRYKNITKGKELPAARHLAFLTWCGYTNAKKWIKEAENLSGLMTLEEHLRSHIHASIVPLEVDFELMDPK